jgi:hypothetical protein
MLKLLGNIITAPVKGPVRGFEFILNAIQGEVESEALDENKVQGELLQLGLRYQAGEIDDAEYQAKEDELLQRLNEIRNYKESLTQEATAIEESETSAHPEVSDGHAEATN